MKFRVLSWEDVANGDFDAKPVDEAYRDTLAQVTGRFDEVWIVDVDSLEDLAKFLDTNGRCVIQDGGDRTTDGQTVFQLIRWQDSVPAQTNH